MKALTPLLTAGALAGAAALTARRAPDDLRGEVAIVTGASRGLGLLLELWVRDSEHERRVFKPQA